MSETPGLDPTVPPSGTGCVECLAADGLVVPPPPLRECGHVGCCDSSPSRHARAHAADTGHPLVQSFEPGEDWFWSFPDDAYYDGPQLAPPHSHPADQPTPGPAGRVPADWMRRLR